MASIVRGPEQRTLSGDSDTVSRSSPDQKTPALVRAERSRRSPSHQIMSDPNPIAVRMERQYEDKGSRTFCRTCTWWKRINSGRGQCWLKMETGYPQPVDQFDVCADHAPKVESNVELRPFAR